MQPVDSSAGAVRSSFVQGRGTTQYLGSPSLPPLSPPWWRLTYWQRNPRCITLACASPIAWTQYICNAPIAFSVQHIVLLCPQCGAGEWVNNYTGQGSLLLRLIARWTIIQDWAHARPARMGTIIRSEYRRRWRGERLYRDVDNYTIIQERCCCGQTTRVESCVKMVLSSCCASCAAGVLVDIPRWWLLIVTECFWLWATQLGNFMQTRCAEVTPPVSVKHNRCIQS